MSDRAKIVTVTAGVICLLAAVVAAWSVWPSLIGWTLVVLEAGIILVAISEIVCAITGWRWRK